MRCRTALYTLLSASTLAISVNSAWAADHEDGSITQDRPADISDFHAFVNPNNDNIVLSMAVNGFSVPGFENEFSTDVLLQIKIDNTGDFVEDLVIQFLFDDGPSGQTVTVIGPARPRKVGAENRILRRASSIRGVFGGDIFRGGNIQKAFAGPTDDATWADLIFVGSLLMGSDLGRAPGIDTVQGLNCATVAVEVSADVLTRQNGRRDNDDDDDDEASADVLTGRNNATINVWATASRQSLTRRSRRRGERSFGSWIQIDRVGIPAVNPLLIPSARQDEYNRSIPSKDVRRFRREVIASILNLNGGNREHAEFAAGILLPDVFVLDTGIPTVFPFGRKPDSDFPDGSLGLLSNGAVVSDGLDANDVEFLDVFPFVPPPHTPNEAIPARN